MHPHESEIRALARATPFNPFVIVTHSGARFRVPSGDHLIFAPDTDEDGQPLEEEDRPAAFQLFSRGISSRWIFFDSVETLDDIFPVSNGE
jgi:hypothetical protein